MIRFYSPDILTTGKLPEDESGHCVRVLRMRAGAEIETVDGVGNAYTCIMTDANPRGVSPVSYTHLTLPTNSRV